MAEPYRSETADFAFVRNNLLVREPAQGETLAAKVAGGWRSNEAAVKALAAEILRILVHIHPRPHRGIAPGRILFRREGGTALAQVDESDDARSVAPDYIAPEQFRGGATARSDLYALGATLVFALTAAAPGELPQRKLAIDFRSRVKLSGPFADWLETMIAPAPEDRFVDAAGALAALTAGKPKRSRFVLVGLSLGLVAVLVAAGGVVFYEMREARRKTEVAAERKTLTGHVIPVQPLPRAPSVEEADLVPLRNFQAHVAPVHSVVFSDDGKTLFTASNDGAVKAWNVADATAIRAYAGHSGEVGSVVLSKDGKTLVTAGDQTVRVWDVATGTPVRTIANADARQVTQALFPSDGNTIVSAGFDGNAKIWDAKTGMLQRTLPHSPGKGRVFALATSADERLVFTGGEDHLVKVWNRGSGALERIIGGHEAPVTAIAAASDGQIILTASDDRTVRAWHARSGASLHVWRDHTDEVWRVVISPKTSLVASGGASGHIRIGELLSWRSRGRAKTSSRTYALAFSPAGDMLASGHRSGGVTLWATAGDRGTKVPRSTKNLVRGPKPGASAEETLYLEAKEALDLWSGDNLDPVEAKLRGLLEKNPRSAFAYVGLSRLELHRAYIKDFEYDQVHLAAAQKHLDKAEELAPKSVPVLLARARIWNALREGDKALKAAKDAEALARDDLDVWLALGSLANDRKDWSEAERRATTVIERATTMNEVARAYWVLRHAYGGRGDFAAQKQTFEIAIEMKPNDAWAMGSYASFLSRHGEYDAAITMAKKAISTMDYGVAHQILARAHARKAAAMLWGGNAAVAKDETDAALAEDPRAVLALYTKGAYLRQLAFQTKKVEHAREAKKAFEAALAADPDYRLAKEALDEHPKVLEAIAR